MERAIMCPQCNAPLAPHKFARSVVCAYCGATIQLEGSSVSAEQFHKAFRIWNSPESYQIPTWVSIGESYWAIGKHIANGDISDVYMGQRARWPSELAIIKILRDQRDKGFFENEWETLRVLQQSDAPGAELFSTFLPQPIIQGDISKGSYMGQMAIILRWASGFYHTFDEVIQAYPQGISPRASIWVWRRILEIVSFLHNSGMVHGAVLPSHLLVQENEHGVRLVGYGAAGRISEKLRILSPRYESFYPKTARSLSIQLDLTMSARCIIALLGGDPKTGSLPRSVPSRLAELVQQVALTESGSSTKLTAWSIREELGVIARDVFGAPQFIPHCDANLKLIRPTLHDDLEKQKGDFDMGSGNYSQTAHEALLRGRASIPAEQVFKQVECHPLMNPKGVRLRESRDGVDHPQSLGIAFALDITGSMGEIPKILATQQLPSFMKTLVDCHVRDPQILFMAVGDAIHNRAPLQVGQFESTAELMDQWLTWTYLEGGGGGNGQESYELGLYFLATHSEMDCMTKRKKRGYLFMTGDEIPYPTLSKHSVEKIIGDNLDEDLTCEEIVAELQKTFIPFFIIPDRARAKRCERRWRDLLGDHVLCLESPIDVCFVTAGAILISEGRVTNLKELANLLIGAGMPSNRRGHVIQTLTPFAEVMLNIEHKPSWISRFFS